MSRTIKQKKTGGKAVARSCRNNGTCTYCTTSRTVSSLRRIDATSEKMKDIDVG